MDDMREIVTAEQANSLFLWLAIGLPIAGLVVGYLFGRRVGAIKGFIAGLFGPLNLLLWKLYNAITDKLGLDSVKNLLVQLALFIAIGLIGGFLLRRLGRGSGGGEPLAVGAPGGPAGTASRNFEDSDAQAREP